MSEGSFLKIANVCSVSTNAALNFTPFLQEKGQGDGAVTNPNGLGMYLLPATNVSGVPGSAAYITVPAEQIHKTVHQVATQQPTVTQQVSVNQTQSGLPANFGFSSPVSLAEVTSQSATLSTKIGSFVDKLILQNETILKGHDVSGVRPRLRATSSYSPKTASPQSKPSTIQSKNPLVFQKLNLPPTQFIPDGLVVKNPKVPTERDVLLKRELSAEKKIRLADAIVRPDSPTSMCLLHPKDESLFASSLVQVHVQKDQAGGLLRDVICGLVCRARVKVSENSALPLDIDLYWCNFCAFKCERKVDFLRHVMSHRFNCWFCTFQAFSRADVVRHCVEKHSSFDAEPWSFCSLLNDHLKLSVETKQESLTVKTEPQDEECLAEEQQESNHESLNLAPVDMVEMSDSEVLKKQVEIINTSARSETTQSQEDADISNEEQWSLEKTESWNCRHCDFVSQDYKLIQIHCTIMHPMMNKSAKAVTVSSELAQQIRKLDMIRKLHLEKGEKEFLKSTESTSSSSNPSVAREEEQVMNEEEEVNQEQDMEEENEEEEESEMDHEENVLEEESKSKDILIYECYNCHGQSLKLREVRKHLSKEHVGEPFIAIDLLAVRRKQARYIIFCPRPGCSFFSRCQQGFSEHITWDDCPGKKDSKQTSDVLQSLSKTALFAQNSMRTIIRGKADSNGKIQRMMCHQKNCRYQCAKPVRMRNHMVRFHFNQKPTYTLAVRHGKKLSKSRIYFCPSCSAFQCNSVQTICEHLLTKHRISDTNSYTVRELLDHGRQAGVEVSAKKVQKTVAEEEEIRPDRGQLEAMMEKYLEDETQNKMATSGSGLRHAAVKAEVRLKTKHQTPRCYKCKFCKYQCLGANLMRTHIHNDHHGVSMIATDVGMRRNKHGGRVYLCPQVGCDFASKNTDEWLHHCAQKHGLESLPIPRDVSELDIRMFSKFPPTYECLYCEGSVVRDTPTLMRLHLTKSHKGEVVVMRDVVARKQCKASRIYMCNKLSCDFITKHQTDYETHIDSCDVVPNGHVSSNSNEQALHNAHKDSETTDDNGISPGMEYIAVADASEETDEIIDLDQATSDDDDLANELDMDEDASHGEEITEVIIQDTTTQDVVRIKVENPDL
ncbi:uncharacterized protein LOC135471946 [Liolophura sinensis]|uniref:uncharacterized protein LOC135471946 n=1 Tax=Liolophura sinensis TaxID=3198878 RepID=UPI0031592CEF